MNQDVDEPDLSKNADQQEKTYDFPRLYRPTLLSASRNSVILLIFMSMKFLAIRGISSPLYFIGMLFVFIFCAQDFLLKVSLDYNKIELYYFGSHQTLTRANIRGRRSVRRHFTKLIELETRSEWERTIRFPAILETDAAWDAWMAGIPDLDGQRGSKPSSPSSSWIVSTLGKNPDAQRRRWGAISKSPGVLFFLCIMAFTSTVLFDRAALASTLTLTAIPWIGLFCLAAMCSNQLPAHLKGSSFWSRLALACLPLLSGVLLFAVSSLEIHRHIYIRYGFFPYYGGLMMLSLIGALTMLIAVWRIFSSINILRRALILIAMLPAVALYFFGIVMSINDVTRI